MALSDTEKMKATITVNLPTPHTKQRDVLASTAKRKVVVTGRRGGKTTAASMYGTDTFLQPGRRILYAAPTKNQTEAFWDACKEYLREGIDAGFIYKNETERVLRLGKSTIKAKTAHDADTLRGDNADLLILDEFQMMNPDAWDVVGAPMLLDNNGDLLVIGSPNKRNHFYKMFRKATADETGRWEAFHFTSYDNPHLSKDALAEITADMTTDNFQQEIMAVFLENQGAVFKDYIDAMNAPPLGLVGKEAHKGHSKIGAVDFGKLNDATAISIGCEDCKLEIFHERITQLDYSAQKKRIVVCYNDFELRGLLPERNSMGEPIIEDLQDAGLFILAGPDDKPGYFTTAANKTSLIENLVLVLERKEWLFIDDPIWNGELEAYERKINAMGRSSFSAPTGLHDDTVMARAILMQAANSHTWLLT